MGDSPIIIYKVTIVERASDGNKAKREKINSIRGDISDKLYINRQRRNNNNN